ncbi:hypothetical protein GU243_17740 [Pseudarthrobacter psychrotolerans]|uniref:Uncharacterized protein n=1 Tax=Pseudarthrobacter psychrotolerans TaxID=2697569 RepID=A0A6P1NPZ1_9MICC|nr:PxKF domain-containing protein [Pseudarthrobacter psychrotolerans]QHK21248.1 hypothetical protein GU243_17740 [Pseudarthrobacter psychrotolerans]
MRPDDVLLTLAVGQPKWPFRGFLQPVDNGGALNSMKAGAAVPVKFGLGGNRGWASWLRERRRRPLSPAPAARHWTTSNRLSPREAVR